MSNLKEIMQRIREQKKEKKRINDMYRDVLSQSKPHAEAVEKIKELVAKKKRLEAEIRQDFSSEFEKSDKLTISLKADAQLLSDMALTKFMKGENIEVTDENDVKYDPIIKITFKKTG